jgi:methanogenic corrinoid protein MtbC1
MRLVQRRTGLGADLLRAWERRHGAVHPARSSGGQRLYRDADIERLLLLKRLTSEGHAISTIATIPTTELRAMVLVSEPGGVDAFTEPPTAAIADPASLLRARDAVDRLDPVELEATLRSAAVELGAVTAVEGLVVPLLQWIGERWAAGALSPAHEHLASDVILRTLHWLREASSTQTGAPGIAFATTQGEQHHLGIQATSVVAAAAGWKVLFLGADLPVSSIVAAVKSSGVSVAAFSVVAPSGAGSGLEQLTAIRTALPTEVSVVVGGAGAVAIADQLRGSGMVVLPSIPEFREFLVTKWNPRVRG